MHVFISYAKKDTRALAERLFRELNAIEGMIAWMDQSLEAASSWVSQIERQIDLCEYMIVLLSPDVMRPETDDQRLSFVRNEIQQALNANPRKRILPVMAQRSRVPLEIATLQLIDATRNEDAAVEEIIAHLCKDAGVQSPSERAKATEHAVHSIYPPIRSIVIVGVMILLSTGAFLVLRTMSAAYETISATPVLAPYGTQSVAGIELVFVPAGCFMMGSDNGDLSEQPVHEQCVEGFWIGRTEVTNSQYGSYGAFSGEDRPRERVNWYEARDFCAANSLRLPTEAEWEYAARGTQNLRYPWGNTFVEENAVYGGNSNNQTADVGSRPGGASWVGALDMVGNVYEWVSSIYEVYPYRDDIRREDLRRTDIERVVRGGAFNITAYELRTTYRSYNIPDFSTYVFGFRCARD